MMYQIGNIPVQIVRSRRKTISLEIKKDCRVVLRVPNRMPKRDIVRFLNEKQSWLEENYARPISLDELAKAVNLTKDYMCALFKKITGETIIQCLTSIRIGHARQLLIQYPDKNVIEIAHMCGFDSPSYFGKIFKQLIGMTPERYRKNG